MDTEDIIVMASAREAAAANRRCHVGNSRYVEFRKFCSGGMMVFTGLMLATLYCLLTHQIQN